MTEPIKVVDLFAGPGGLGEGFSSCTVPGETDDPPPFRIVASVEKDPAAHRTLRLRAFYRQFQENKVPDAYFDYVSDPDSVDLAAKYPEQWARACEEALLLELGDENDDRTLDDRLDQVLDDDPWVLIGGPPCQAYSLVGRARNRGIEGYEPEKDRRHFLYQDYLRIIRERRPTAFVMENVRGLLSSTVGGVRIFQQILEDLQDPEKAAGQGTSPDGQGYRLYSVTTGRWMGRGQNASQLEPGDFLVKTELYGIPQRRHRVIILGVREDIAPDEGPVLPAPVQSATSIEAVIEDLPNLRSGLSRRNNGIEDSFENWKTTIIELCDSMADEIAADPNSDRFDQRYSTIADRLRELADDYRKRNDVLDRAATTSGRYSAAYDKQMPGHLVKWFRNDRLHRIPNHETRAHIPADLGRYLFASVWADEFDSSPKASNFPPCLAPQHRNWESGKFADRFRVQNRNGAATTVTSHIAKDGHYFIHYDQQQCRSLTVREAARIQTFPDDYFFEGNRTQQYGQVGNAVPPYLGKQIAQAILCIFPSNK